MQEEIEVEVKVSVIIPCYNTERFLRECLDSFVNQTLKEIEIICVDDGSTDGTFRILQEYAQKDERFKLLTQANQFAGVARNTGMEIARGKYLYICDSDDIFEPIMLEKLYQKSEEDRADICLFGGGDYDMSTGLYSYRYGLFHNYLPEKIPFSSADVIQDIYKVHHIATCSKLYNKSFVDSHNLKFQALSTAEDVFFNNCAIAVAERITAVDDWLWTYRKGISTSLIGTLHNRPFCIDEAYRAVKEFLVEKQLYSKVARGLKELILGSGIYSLEMMKTEEAWLRCALFIREKYVPEFELLECFDFSTHDYNLQRLRYIVESSMEELHGYRPFLRTYEPDKTLEWGFALNETPVKVSVIIPIYNCEDYLKECLVSVLNQTLADIEVICVNDGSTDKSLEILNHFAQEDSRIQIISQANKGSSSARNVGLNYATGEYVMFVDSDDLLIRISVDHLYRKAKYNDLDQLFCEGAVIYESRDLYSDKEKMLNYYKYKGEYSVIYHGSELLTQLVKEKNFRESPCMQIFKLNFLKDNDIYFDEGMIYKDNIFTYKTLKNAERVMIHKEELYIKRYRKKAPLISFEEIYGYFQCVGFIESLELIEYGTYKELMKLLPDAWDRLEEESPVISNEILKGVNSLLVDNKLHPILQDKYISYILRSLFFEKWRAIFENEENSKTWLDLIRMVLQHIDDDIIDDVASENNLMKHKRDILFSFKNIDGLKEDKELVEAILCDLKESERQDELNLSLSKIENFPAYMNLLSQNQENYIAIFCSRDNIGTQMSEEFADMMLNLGFKIDLHRTRGLGGRSYRPFIAVLDSGKVIVEKLGAADQKNLIHLQGDYFIKSTVWIKGKECEQALITQHSTDYCSNNRGLNIVVFSKESGLIIDSVCFDFTLKKYKFSRLDKIPKKISH